MHAPCPLPKFLFSNHIPFNARSKPPAPQEERIVMIIVTVARALGAFFASLPGSFAEAQKLRREFYRRHPFMEF